jgi:AraC-like DNA-binding protein
MASSVEVLLSMPGVRATRWTTQDLYACIKDYYAIGRIDRGHTEWWGGGKLWRSAPGHVQVKQPGDVHRDVVRHGATTWTVVTLPADEIARARDAGHLAVLPQLEPGDERAAPFNRLFDAVLAGAEQLTLDVAVAEAVSAFAVISRANLDQTRPVRRAMEYLREHLADPVTLDDLAAHAELDKFHLCRAFRVQIGLPPHAYLTGMRIARAKELLRRGARASDVAPLVGIYDQAQLTKHFRRLVGTTPARYAREGATKTFSATAVRP